MSLRTPCEGQGGSGAVAASKATRHTRPRSEDEVAGRPWRTVPPSTLPRRRRREMSLWTRPRGGGGACRRGRGCKTPAKAVASADVAPQGGGRGRAGEATVDKATGRPPRSSLPRPWTCRTAAGDVTADVPRRSGARGHRRGRQQVTIAAEGGSAGTSLPQMRQWGRRWGEMPSVVAPTRCPTAADKAAGRPR